MRIAAFVASLLLIAACDTNNEHHVYQRERPFAGGFVEAISAIQSSPRRAACEARYNGLQQEVAQALDARRDLIERYTLEVGIQASGPSRAPRSRRPLGPCVLVEPAPLSAEGASNAYSEGWDTVAEIYALVKLDKYDNALNWSWLHMLAESVAANDGQKMSGLSMGLDGDSLDHVRTLRTLLDTCVADAQCTALMLPSELAAYVRAKNAVYAAHAQAIDTASTRALKRQKIRDWSRQVDTDAQFYGFKVNETITADPATGVLNLPLQIGDFAGEEATLASIIEANWRNDDVRVHVQWVSADEMPKAFRFVSHALEGNGRAYVSPSQRTINLFAEVTPKVIAHELGHVIGLSDHYYTQWDDAACHYDVRVDHTDIMSNHENGSVTASEWREIRENYDF